MNSPLPFEEMQRPEIQEALKEMWETFRQQATAPMISALFAPPPDVIGALRGDERLQKEEGVVYSWEIDA